jgi:hypothetical protein
MRMIDVISGTGASDANFSIEQTNDGAYQVMVDPCALDFRLPVGAPFRAADEAKGWIETQSADWFSRFRYGV